MSTTERTLVHKRAKPIYSTRPAATIVGVLFIAAFGTAILGLFFYQPILTGPEYLVNGAQHKSQVELGAFMELLLVCSNIGTAIGLFPFLRPYGERIALAHISFRFLEAVIITIGIVGVLSLLTLSQDFVAAAAPDASAYHVAGTLLIAIHDWTFMLGPDFMLGINTLMYSYLLYKSGLVPRPLAVWGLTGATLVFIAAVLELFGVIAQISVWGAVLSVPIASYELILAGWLIVRGFNAAAMASEPARPATNALLSAA